MSTNCQYTKLHDIYTTDKDSPLLLGVFFGEIVSPTNITSGETFPLSVLVVVLDTAAPLALQLIALSSAGLANDAEASLVDDNVVTDCVDDEDTPALVVTSVDRKSGV